MNLLDLASVRQTDIVDTKVVFGVINVLALFAPKAGNDAQIGEERGGALSGDGASEGESEEGDGTHIAR